MHFQINNPVLTDTQEPTTHTASPAKSGLSGLLAGVKKSESAKRSRSRKVKFLGIGLGFCLLAGIIVYFVYQIKKLTSSYQTELRAPDRVEPLDTTKTKMGSLAQIYDKAERFKYEDSLELLRESQTMGHIVMDWENLYDVRKKQFKQKQQNPTSEADSLEALLASLSRESDSIQTKKTSVTTQTTAARQEKPSASSSTTASRNSAAPVARGKRKSTSVAFSGNKTEPGGEGFNTFTPGSANNIASGSIASESAAFSSQSSLGSVLVKAVVHGEHKVQQGSKVIFRLLESVSFEGVRLDKNTLVTGLAQFRNGRITFSQFRARSQPALIPFLCYDTDMVAGIPFADQSPVENEVRGAGSSALSDAADELSYAIPYGSVARAASGLGRGILRGKERSRTLFINLSDGYPVLLELTSEKN